MNKVYIVREKVEYIDGFDSENNHDIIQGVYTTKEAAEKRMNEVFGNCRDSVEGEDGKTYDTESGNNRIGLNVYDDGEISEEWFWHIEEHDLQEVA